MKITVIFNHGVVLTESRTPRKDEQDPSELKIWYPMSNNMGSGSLQSRVNIDEEGIAWLHGHYLPDSHEVAAARTAQALKNRYWTNSTGD